MESIEKDKLQVFINEQEIKGMSVAEKLHWNRNGNKGSKCNIESLW
jgi:hypothetical protein